MRRLHTFAALTATAIALTACSGGDASTVEADTSVADEGGDAAQDATGGAVSREAPVAAGDFSTGAMAVDGERAVEEGRPPQDVTFASVAASPWVTTSDDALSTFAMDVDTASYTVVRQWLANGWQVDPAMVRLEEFVNRFTYDYPSPSADEVWSVTTDAAPAPWTSPRGDTLLVRVGLQAWAVADEDRPDATLTFVIDTSGSMRGDDRLGLVQRSLRLLAQRLRPTDRIAIVAYGDDARLVLRPTPLSEPDVVLDAIDELSADGSTFAEGGLRLGYVTARNAFDPDGLNAVVLASDGVANVGETGPDAILQRAREEAADGISLLALGVGLGNFNDVLLERLANDGDGTYFYIDTDEEADRLFGDRLVSTLMPVAAEAKVQVAFDDDVVTDWRLLGYDNRALADEDFRNDEVDAGEVGAGHQVTALYEVVLRDEPAADLATGATALEVSLRWADPVDESRVRESATTVTVADLLADARADHALATTAAALAELLRDSADVDWSLGELLAWAEEALPAATPTAGQDDLTELLALIGQARDVEPE